MNKKAPNPPPPDEFGLFRPKPPPAPPLPEHFKIAYQRLLDQVLEENAEYKRVLTHIAVFETDKERMRKAAKDAINVSKT